MFLFIWLPVFNMHLYFLHSSHIYMFSSRWILKYFCSVASVHFFYLFLFNLILSCFIWRGLYCSIKYRLTILLREWINIPWQLLSHLFACIKKSDLHLNNVLLHLSYQGDHFSCESFVFSLRRGRENNFPHPALRVVWFHWRLQLTVQMPRARVFSPECSTFTF